MIPLANPRTCCLQAQLGREETANNKQMSTTHSLQLGGRGRRDAQQVRKQTQFPNLGSGRVGCGGCQVLGPQMRFEDENGQLVNYMPWLLTRETLKF